MNRELRQRIMQFLETHIGNNEAARSSILEAALYGCGVIRQIGNFDETPSIFTSRLIDTLVNYGQCDGDTEHALVILIRHIGSQKGMDVQRQTKQLCDELLETSHIEIVTPVTAGQMINGRYKLLQLIGDASGQATVWRAQDMHDPQVPPIAVKCMKPHPTRDYAARFLEEVRSVRVLDDHPHIVHIYDYGVDRGLRFLVMPMMRESLRVVLDRRGSLPSDETIEYLTQIANALDFAHQHRITHRDLKPANLLFTRETGRLCLADFGISYRENREAPITGTGETAATEEYAAPEQLRATGIVTPKSDIYALAIIAYELLAGERPFKGSKSEVAVQHLKDELPEHPHLPPFVVQVLRIGAAKDSAQRPTSAMALVDMLRDALAGKAPAVLQHYLDKVLPSHLLEVMPDYVFRGLHNAFVDPAAEVRQQEDAPSTETEQVDWGLFPPEVSEADKPSDSLMIELGGELRPPHEGHYSDQVEYMGNVRERIKDLKRVVLLGEPGAGKTFMLARLALDYAEQCRTDPNQRLPVFVPLSRYDSSEPLETFVAARMGVLGERLHELNLIWLLDALNEMPRDKNQWQHLKTFIDALVKSDTPFVLTCRVKNYEEDLHDVPGLHRLDLQDLNPQQIYDILKHFLTERYANPIWNTVMFGSDDLLAAWQGWDGSVLTFWEMPEGNWWDWDAHQKARVRVHDDLRKLMLLCRNPFTLVRLLVMRMGKAVKRCECDLQRLSQQLDEQLPNNRALLFGAVIGDMVQAEAERQGWNETDIRAVTAMLEKTAAVLQAQQQRTEMPLPDLLKESSTEGLIWLQMGRDAGLITLGEASVRFNHQLFQEYFATKRLSDLLDDYNRRYPDWENADPLPPRDERLAEIFPQWWDAGGWRVTVALLGELEGKTGINRVVRWLASYAAEITLNMLIDNNDGLSVQDLSETAQSALIAGAFTRTEENNPIGRAAAYRVLGLLDADKRPGIGMITRSDGTKLPDIDWVLIPSGEFTYGDDNQANYTDLAKPAKAQRLVLPAFELSRYPVTYSQFQTFIDDTKGFYEPRWWEGLVDNNYRHENQLAPGDQWFKYSNHPRDNVSWYDAIAFCRWLSWRLGGGYELDKLETWTVRLPTEFEWEKAARANTGWVYPWGQEYQKGYANVDEIRDKAGQHYVEQTSAVGIYQNSDTPHWGKPISDLSGNVWEWCLTAYDNPQLKATREDVSTDALRVQRGGSWDDLQSFARTTYRVRYDPVNRHFTVGFRVCRPVQTKT